MRTTKQECSKIYVKLSNEVIDKLDALASSRGLSRSGLIAYYVGKSLEEEMLLTEAKKRLTSPDGFGTILNALGANLEALENKK